MPRLIVAAAIATMLAAPQTHAQDIEEGEKVFKKCKTCHRVGEDAKHAAGPVLNNIIGRPVATAEGFTKYSKDMLAMGETGMVWTAELIDAWITDPRAFLREQTGNKRAKTKMTIKVKDPTDRLNVIAYVSQFSDGVESVSADEDVASQPDVMVNPDKNQLCVVNASPEDRFFAVEIRDGARLTGTVEAGGALCSDAMVDVVGGTVSVFETEDSLEGCSRLVSGEQVAAGFVEELRKYAEFDRCLWASNDG